MRQDHKRNISPTRFMGILGALRSIGLNLAVGSLVTISVTCYSSAAPDQVEQLGNCIWSALSTAQKLTRENKYEEGRKELKNSLIQCNEGDLNDNEAANVYNFLAAIEIKSGDRPSALYYLNNALQYENIPHKMSQSMRYTAAQLMFAAGSWHEGLHLLESYALSADTKPPSLYALLAQAYKKNGRLNSAITSMEEALAQSASVTREQKTKWAKLLATFYAERGDKQRSLQVLAQYDIDSTLAHVPQDFVVNRTPPRAVEIIAPSYPADAKSNHVDGFCVVEFTIDKHGRIQDERIKDCEPAGFFEEASLSAIKNFRYKPARENGEPVEQKDFAYEFIYD